MEKSEITYQELMSRLSQAEEILAAIRGVQVDAVVGDNDILLLRVRETEEALQKAYQELERQAEQRAKELVIANAALRAEIVERQRVEEVLRRSEELFQIFMDNSPATVYVKNEEGRYIYANKRLGQLLNLSSTDLLGKTDFDFWPVEIAQQLRAHDATVLAANKTIEIEETTQHGDKVCHWLSLKFPLTDDGGRRIIAGMSVDITDRKRAEEDLHLMSKVFKNAADPILIKDLSGRILDVNAEVERVYGWTREELLGQSVKILSPPERKAYTDEITERCKCGEEVRNVEGVRWTKAGQRTPVLLTLSLLTDTTGQPRAIAAIAKDISALKRVEAILQKKNALTTLLQEVASAANNASTLTKVLQFTLERVCHYTGWCVGHAYLPAEQSLAGFSSSHVWHLEDAARFETFRGVTEGTSFAPGVGVVGKVLARGQPVWIVDVSKDLGFVRARQAEAVGLRAAFVVPVLVRTQIVAVLEFFSTEAVERDEALLEAMVHIGAQLGRVVERQHAEEALTFQAHVLENMVEGVNLVDEQGIMAFTNPAFDAMFGYKRGELLGKHASVLNYPAEDAVRIAETIIAQLRAYPRWAGELKNRKKDGTLFLTYARVGRMERAGKRYWVSVREDITERKRAEEKLRESERLATIGTTAAKLVHEIGNPLNGMYTTVQLLERHISRQSEQADDLLISTVQDLKNETHRLRSLLQELRSFSRPPKLHFQSLSLRELVEELLLTESPYYTECGVRVEQDLSAELPPVLADGERIKQVLLNLCKNAVEAMPQGGTLRVCGYTSGEQVCVEVKDTGEGIPEEVDIFEPFISTKPEGTGLGLAIVRQIVADHKGKITYSSAPGQGTTFTLVFPTAPVNKEQI